MSEFKNRQLDHSELIQLKRWNTPSVYNGWEQVTKQDPAKDAFNIEETRDFMPQMGPMVGYAVTLLIEPSNPQHKISNPNAYIEYLHYIANTPGPKIVIVQDLDKPNTVGSFWGEVNSNVHKSLGCIGTITDGAIRDLDEMTNAGFKALAKRLCVGHAYPSCIRWDCEVEVFGRKVNSGDLIHADKHGFMVIKPEEQAGLLEAVRFMDANECNTIIPDARNTTGLSTPDILKNISQSLKEFSKNVKDKFSSEGEW